MGLWWKKKRNLYFFWFFTKFFLFFTVLEATDAESLLDQFEEAATSDVEAEENPKKTSNIYKAVKNHFAASGHVNPKRNPRIGKNQIKVK